MGTTPTNKKTKKAEQSLPATTTSEVSTTKILPLDLSVDKIRANFDIELTRNKFNELQKEMNSIVWSEENLPVIAEKIKAIKKMKTVVDEKHSTSKSPYWTICQNHDKVKNDLYLVIDNILEEPIKKYSKMAQEVKDRQEKQKADEARIATIKSGIEGNAVVFARRAANATTPAELYQLELDIEREKKLDKKYQEFLPVAIAKYDELKEIIAKQKEVVKENVKVTTQLEKAIAKGDEEKIEKLTEKKEELANQIEEHQVNVQEASVSGTSSIPARYATEVYPTLKGGRTLWKAEIVDVKEAFKNAQHLLEISLNSEAIKTSIKTLKDAKVFEGKTEYVVNGIRYYEDKKMI